MKRFFFDSLESTQTKAKELLADERASPPLSFVVIADEQTGGRGRSGNDWVSPRGNLYMTMVLPVKFVPLRDVGQLSFLMAVALSDTLKCFGVSDILLKWPNDVLVAGRKIAGILLETGDGVGNVLYSVLIGVGVNLDSSPENAVSLKDVISSPQELPTREAFIDVFVDAVYARLAQWETFGFAPIRQDWIQQAKGIGGRICVRLPRETFYGVFDGIDVDGSLLLSLERGEIRRIHSGDVFFEETALSV